MRLCVSFFLSSPTRTLLQSTLAILALILIIDGLTGPQVGSMNLAGVLPWIHWRGLVVIGLLSAGNVFCYACPFTLPRKLAGNWFRADRAWPKALRSKWLAVALVGLFLWSYEAFALWDSPWWTAWIAIGYFTAAFVVDSLFRGSSFCKYVCPIGQFHFVQSLISPLEVKVREPATCSTCRTADCIQGRGDLPGCQLGLFQPKKSGNMDCTFCLECVHACPHDNIGLIAITPMKSTWTDPPRSGVGRFSERSDLAALVLILVFGAFANAAGMVAPVLDWQNRFKSDLGMDSLLPITTLYYLFAIVVLPLLAITIATTMSHFFLTRPNRPHDTPPPHAIALPRSMPPLSAVALPRSRHAPRAVAIAREPFTSAVPIPETQSPLNSRSWLAIASRFSLALVPIGFAMWLAHYSFHFVTSYQTIIPTAQRFAIDHGWSGLGQPIWSCACCQPVGDWLLILEVLALDIGLLASLYSTWRIALSTAANNATAMKAAIPWGTIALGLFSLGIWILFQPMEMRGTM